MASVSPSFSSRATRLGFTVTTRAQEEVVPASDYRILRNPIRELHRLLGKKTLEAELLKEALDAINGSKSICCAQCRGPRTVRDEGRLRGPGRGPVDHRRLCQGSPRQA